MKDPLPVVTSLEIHSFLGSSKFERASHLKLMSYSRLLATVDNAEPSWISLRIKKRISKNIIVKLKDIF